MAGTYEVTQLLRNSGYLAYSVIALPPITLHFPDDLLVVAAGEIMFDAIFLVVSYNHQIGFIRLHCFDHENALNIMDNSTSSFYMK